MKKILKLVATSVFISGIALANTAISYAGSDDIEFRVHNESSYVWKVIEVTSGYGIDSSPSVYPVPPGKHTSPIFHFNDTDWEGAVSVTYAAYKNNNQLMAQCQYKLKYPLIKSHTKAYKISVVPQEGTNPKDCLLARKSVFVDTGIGSLTVEVHPLLRVEAAKIQAKIYQ